MKRSSRFLALSALLACVGAPLGACTPAPFVTPGPSDRKPAKKCLLNGCPHTTTHNGGYCCAAHCWEDRLRRRRAQTKETHAR